MSFGRKKNADDNVHRKERRERRKLFHISCQRRGEVVISALPRPPVGLSYHFFPTVAFGSLSQCLTMTPEHLSLSRQRNAFRI